MKNISTVNNLPGAESNHVLAQIGRASLKTGIFLAKWKPLLGIGVNLLFLMAISAFPAFAQIGSNPFGSSGTTKLANAGSNILVIGTWLAFFVGLLSFVLIPIFVKFEWNYTKLLVSGFTGLGGFLVIGSIAYDIVNLSSITMNDPSIGH